MLADFVAEVFPLPGPTFQERVMRFLLWGVRDRVDVGGFIEWLSLQYREWYKYEFWRFVLVHDVVEKLAMTAIEFPPMQKGASFNLDAVKEKIAAARNAIAR